MLDFWMRTSGTWINAITIVLGTTVGLVLGERLPKPMQQIITQGVGLLTLLIGMGMANSLMGTRAGQLDGVIVGLLAMVIGGLLGEWLGIEDRLEAVGNWLKRQFRGQGRFTEGFVAASLLFCIGPMAIIGSLNNGITGDNALLLIKAAMDGLAAIALTSSYGLGVGFSTLSIVLFQGSLSLAAGSLAQVLPDPASAPPVLLITGVGGLMILGLGLNLLDIGKVKVASFLPSLFVVLLIYWLGDRLT
ncbi:MAG TPA: DUF554 domain-containing protein [Chroococcidiopsis sp.]